MKYRLTRRAENSIDELIYYIARENPNAAQRVYKCIVETFESVVEFQYSGRTIDFLGDPDIRCKNVKKYNDYLVFYRIKHNEIVISVVQHGARDLPIIIGEL